MDNTPNELEEKVLRGDAAIKLWLEGRDKWNEWAVTHQDWSVDFSGVDFSKYRQENKAISFSEFQFPNKKDRPDNAPLSKVNFSGAQFGEGDVDFFFAQFCRGEVDFSGAQFGKGEVIFVCAQFGEGGVNFSGAQFGEGRVNFLVSQFGEGRVDFSGAQFGEGDVGFIGAQFGEGSVDFGRAQFGKGEVIFNGAQFGEGRVSFIGAQFGEGSVDFGRAQFGEGSVDFSGAQFGKGNVVFKYATLESGALLFNDARFNQGDVDFSFIQAGNGTSQFMGATFGEGMISFTGSHFQGSLSFNPFYVEECTALLFNNMTINGYLSFGALKTRCLLDLRETSINRPPSLDQLEISHQEEEKYCSFWPFRYKRSLRTDANVCYRHLKMLADRADDHERKLEFFAREMRCGYGHTLTGCRFYLYRIYDLLSDYGRSLSRPGLCLFVLAAICAMIYGGASWNQHSLENQPPASKELLLSAFVFSVGHTLPFYFGSKTAVSDATKTLFGESITNIPDWIHFITIFQGMVGGLLLFLVGLALRNNFRS